MNNISQKGTTFEGYFLYLGLTIFKKYATILAK